MARRSWQIAEEVLWRHVVPNAAMTRVLKSGCQRDASSPRLLGVGWRRRFLSNLMDFDRAGLRTRQEPLPLQTVDFSDRLSDLCRGNNGKSSGQQE